MSLIGCEHFMREGGYPDIVLWDPTSQAEDYKHRRALAVVELKATFPDHGQYRENMWDSIGLGDYTKVRRLVQNGDTDWGLALVFCALPSESEAQKFDPSRTPAFEGELKVARFRIVNYDQVPDFHLI